VSFVRALWQRRILYLALVLVVAIEVTITVTQIPFYRDLPNLQPEVGGRKWPVYVMLPMLTTALTVYFAAAAGFVISKDAGRYRRYLRLMWFFASIGAVINVTHALNQLERAGSGEWLSAVFLGSGSLFTPIVWHTYAGIKVTTTIKLMSIAELMAISRQWARHPRLSWRCAQYVDLFPSLDRAQVWEMVIRQSRNKALIKLGVQPAPERHQETPASWRKPSTWKRGKVEATSIDDDAALAELEVSLALPAAPGRMSQETPEETWKPADEGPCETTAEREYKRVWVAAAYYLINQAQVPRVTQSEVARLLETTPGTVSKVFAACRANDIEASSIDPQTYAAVMATFRAQGGKPRKETERVSRN
jgi:hypothetical protein